MQDRNFDDIAEKFSRNIYGTTKGQLRQAILWQDLEPLLKPVGMKDEAGKPRPDHPVKVFAKTGTLNFVTALAGYIHRPDGRRIVFATFMADTARRDAIPVEERERPEGVQGWTARARRLQLHLIERWSSLPMA